MTLRTIAVIGTGHTAVCPDGPLVPFPPSVRRHGRPLAAGERVARVRLLDLRQRREDAVARIAVGHLRVEVVDPALHRGEAAGGVGAGAGARLLQLADLPILAVGEIP